MNRLGSRVLAAVGAGAFAVAMTVIGGVPADAAPVSGPITQARDLLGVWVGEMTGYNEAQEVDLQYRLTVRKAKGQAGIAWEEWRNCEENKAACAAGKTTGGGWTQPSRILFVMDKGHVVHGVGETGFWNGTTNSTGDVLSAVKVCQGAPDGLTWTTRASTSDTQATMQLGRHVIGGDMVRQST
jgi:hypothetical protein